MDTVFILTFLLPVILATTGFNPTQHHDYEAMEAVMNNVHEKCNKITHLYELPTGTFEDIPSTTVNGRKLKVLVFGKHPTEHTNGIPEFKYIGNMHGNEVTGKELLLRLMTYMCDVYLGETTEIEGNFDMKHIKDLIDNTRIHILPSMNPDGWQIASESVDNYQNGVLGSDKWTVGRANANGKDLNRNFPDLDNLYYNLEAKPGHRNNHLDRVRQVLKNLSSELEPETKMIMSWLHSIPFVASANMHNGDLVANYPFDKTRDGSSHSPAKCPDNSTEMAEAYSLQHADMAKPHKPCDTNDFSKTEGTTNGAAWYSVPGASELPKIWEQNINSLFSFMYQAHIGIKGEIQLPEGIRPGSAIAAIRVQKVGEPKPIDHDILSTESGDYYRLLENGLYNVNATIHFMDRNDNEQKIVRSKCVQVDNQLYSKSAQVVNFDFTQLDEPYIDESCKNEYQDSYDEDQLRQYYDLMWFLRNYAAPRNTYDSKYNVY
ncbi:CBPE-like protein [Mya arenaria]|uniref:CBPE-like protein n=1 Tax=Mya arenaria TaxID=6604 RepID=A0ABY7DIX5_MYAAR|nr:CBPE-like protein [Mya arenaria]